MKNETQDRTAFIGGSDIAAILGLSRWKTALAVWAEKTGQLPPDEGPKPLRMRLGNRLEEVVAELFMEETGKRLIRANERRVHPKYPHFRAQIDRLVVDEDATWEGKTTTVFLKKDWVDDEVPQEALCQAMWGLGVTGKKYTYVAGLIGNQEFKWKKIERDPLLIAEMFKRANAFWNDFIVPKVMPVQISAADSATIYSLFPNAEPDTEIDLGDDVAKLVESRNSLYQDQIVLEKQIEQTENEIKLKIGANESGKAGKWLVTWKPQITRRLDTALLKNNEPDLYKKYTKESPSRVFRIKEIKDGPRV